MFSLAPGWKVPATAWFIMSSAWFKWCFTAGSLSNSASNIPFQPEYLEINETSTMNQLKKFIVDNAKSIQVHEVWGS